ncbi:MmcQ/YjbR family DNA-binding protein [Simiduia aestuariiviva]|uniref:Putative DNA-binding protein (MmcQ/YjbR family) n=1 Tax=Simiduia aestuariiviva TaxID=1510459 RepID=A0A839UG35_9GAMM|nr:MmcQ/YjbR family DNA-binding protein [Simiduia aestuariiviva]MBB3167004.1 putative DNA-binding protein (MmcQ/YjbR family) [Simiduia aestuariiviva]
MPGAPSLKQLQTLLLDHVAATEDTPFGPDVLVYRVCGKMFALLAWRDDPMRLNVKCDPIEAEFLREQFTAVLPGYHMNKKHWNTLVLDGTLDWDFVQAQVAASYGLIVKGLKKSEREALQHTPARS